MYATSSELTSRHSRPNYEANHNKSLFSNTFLTLTFLELDMLRFIHICISFLKNQANCS